MKKSIANATKFNYTKITGDMMNDGLFKNIDSVEIEKILKSLNARKVSFKKDMTILSNLSNTYEIGIILSGKASLIRIDYNGVRSIVSELTTNELFGGCFSDYMTDEMSVISNSDCEILFVEYNLLLGQGRRKVPSQEQLIQNIIDILVKKINSYNRRIEILNKRSIRDKLLEYFHILKMEQKSNTIYIPFSYTTLAEYLSIDRSAMMRELKNLKDENIIMTNNRKVTLILR